MVNSCNYVHAEREHLARELASVAAREHALVQLQAGQASAAAEEETRLVKQAQALDAQRAKLQAQFAQAVKGISLLNPGVLACASTPHALSCKSLPDKNLFLTSIWKLLYLNIQ